MSSVDRQSVIVNQMAKYGVYPALARRLVREHGEEAVMRQLEWLPWRRAANRAAVLVRAIEEGYAPPDGAGEAAEPLEATNYYGGRFPCCRVCQARPCVCNDPEYAALEERIQAQFPLKSLTRRNDMRAAPI